MRAIILVGGFLFFTPLLLRAQWTGQYQANVNGDITTLELRQTGDSIKGGLRDASQSYQVLGKVASPNTSQPARFSGIAREAILGITFELKAERQSGGIFIDAQLRFLGTLQPAFQALFVPTNQAVATSGAAPVRTGGTTASKPASSTTPAELRNKTLDPGLVRLWRHESNYSSGYGSDFLGSTVTYIAINADKTMTQAGSQAYVSGADFSGRSSSDGGDVAPIPNYWLYTEGNRLMECALVNGQLQHNHLANYYLENGRLLLTDPRNGERKLYTAAR